MLGVDEIEQRLFGFLGAYAGKRRDHGVGQRPLVVLLLLVAQAVGRSVRHEVAQDIEEIAFEHGAGFGRGQGMEGTRTDGEARETQGTTQGGGCRLAPIEEGHEVHRDGAAGVRRSGVDDVGEPRDEPLDVADVRGPLFVGPKGAGHLAVGGAGDLDEKVGRLGVVEGEQRRRVGRTLALAAVHLRPVADEQAKHPDGFRGVGVHPDEDAAQPVGLGEQALDGPRARVVVLERPGLGHGERERPARLARTLEGALGLLLVRQSRQGGDVRPARPLLLRRLAASRRDRRCRPAARSSTRSASRGWSRAGLSGAWPS